MDDMYDDCDVVDENMIEILDKQINSKNNNNKLLEMEIVSFWIINRSPPESVATRHSYVDERSFGGTIYGRTMDLLFSQRVMDSSLYGLLNFIDPRA